jgi:predicted cupin superfamily sugar epimerase
MTQLSAEEVIAALGLEPHPLEGGFFHETYRTPQRMHGKERSLATAIYYLLTPNTCSAMHRLPTDELFHFYLGDPVQQLQLYPDGTGKVVTIGPDLLAGQRPQVLVSGGIWQGACLADGGRLALLGTTMTPGFAYPDYQKGRRDELVGQYPEFTALIERLTVSPDDTDE